MTRRPHRLPRRRTAVAFVLLGAAALGACDRQTSAAQLEIAGELRALRLALQAREADANTAPPAIERAEIAAALAPLREVLDGLGAAQRELATRQATLTQELGRWTQLLVASSSEQRAAEARDLAARLTQLEQSMAAQDTRHREVEALLQGALDRTADRLEDFLQRLQREPKPASNPTPVDATAPGREAGTGDDGTPAPRPAGGEQRASIDWLWYVLLPFALVSSAVVIRQLWRARGPIGPLPIRSEPMPAEAPKVGQGSAGQDPEVRELWAAAALLGEAVGRLRHSGPTGENGATAEPPAGDGGPGDRSSDEPAPGDRSPDDLDLDDLFVIDDSDEVEVAAQREPAPASIAATARAVGPPMVSVHVPAVLGDPAAAHARLLGLLQADPRVLLEPAPQLQPAAGGWRVAFGVLPGLPPGERTLLEQQLRDSVA